MNQAEYDRKIKDLHAHYMLDTVTRAETLRTLRGLGFTPAQTVQLLHHWTDERKILDRDEGDEAIFTAPNQWEVIG